MTRKKKGATDEEVFCSLKAPISAMEQMAKATPDQKKAGMDAWMTWTKKAGSAVVDLGMPLGDGMELSKGSVSKTKTPVMGFSILQGESMTDITKLLEAHPHLSIPGSAIEVFEGSRCPECSRSYRAPISALAFFLGRQAARRAGMITPMCRNIRVLHNFVPPTTPEEIRDAALQFVRKVSGIHKPSQADEAAFTHAISACHR